MVSLITLETTEILAVITFLILIAGYLWGFARLIQKLELKPDYKDVENMIEKKFENHCPFIDKINNVENDVRDIKEWKDDRVELLHRVEKEIQQVRINTEMICDELKISYKK